MPGQNEIVKAIFQLEVEHSKLDEGLKQVAGQYGKINTEISKQTEQLQQLTDQETKLVEARKKANSPNLIMEYDKKLTEVRTSIQAINEENLNMVKSQREIQKEATITGRRLSTAFNKTVIQGATNQIRDTNRALIQSGIEAGNAGRKTNEAVGKTVNKFTELRNSIKQAKADLAEALAGGNADAIQAASEKVGKLKDEFNDLNDTANAFASGSKFQQIGNLLGDVTANVLKLDFGRANEQSQALLKTTKQLTFKEAVTGIKDLGSTFVNLGRSLLANPIFLLGILITTIISKFDALKNAGGLIGKVFVGIGRAIDVIITAGKDLLDFIGLIDSTKKSLEELIDQQEFLIKQTENFFAKTLATRKANQQATIQLENEKSEAIKRALFKEIKDTQAAMLEKAITREDYLEYEKKLVDLGIRFNQVATEKEVRNIQIIVDAKNKLRKINEDLLKEKDKSLQFNIDFKLPEGSDKQIKAGFDLQRAELKRQQAEEKRQAAIDFADYDGGRKARALIDQKYSVIKKNLANQESKALIDAEKKRSLERIELVKTTEEELLDIASAQNMLSEEQIAEEKVAILIKYYQSKDKLLKADLERNKAAGLSTIQLEKEIQATKKEGELSVITAQDALNKTYLRKNTERLEEEGRFNLEMLRLNRSLRLKFNEIEQDRVVEDLTLQVIYHREKLDLLKASGEATAEELQKQTNEQMELEANLTKAQEKATMERTMIMVDGVKTVLDATISASNQILQNAIENNDALTQSQEKRIEEAKSLAEQGNASLLEEEEKRLSDLQRTKEKFVRDQQALSAIQIATESAVAIAKAAAEGGAAAPFTIAATLIALIAGLAQAKAVASRAAYYKGGLFEGEGYTGDGNPRNESMLLGYKPYDYHKQEFIFNHQNTHKYRDIFEDVHAGKIDLNSWKEKVKAFEVMQHAQRLNIAQVVIPQVGGYSDIDGIKSQLEQLTNVVKKQSMYLNIDSEGFTAHLNNIQTRSDFIKNRLAKP